MNSTKKKSGSAPKQTATISGWPNGLAQEIRENASTDPLVTSPIQSENLSSEEIEKILAAPSDIDPQIIKNHFED